MYIDMYVKPCLASRRLIAHLRLRAVGGQSRFGPDKHTDDVDISCLSQHRRQALLTHHPDKNDEPEYSVDEIEHAHEVLKPGALGVGRRHEIELECVAKINQATGTYTHPLCTVDC